MSLIEIMVTAGLFGVILTMVGKAMVTAHRTEASLSHNVAIVRRASMALDMLVRDAELAGQISDIYYFDSANTRQTIPTSTYRLTAPEEFMIDRMQKSGLPASMPVRISVGYWWDNTDFTFRRALYDSAGTPLPGTPAAGKILVEDVQDFDISLATMGGLSVLTARLKVATIGAPISISVALEP